MIETLLVVSLVFGGWNWFAKEQAQGKVESQKKIIETQSDVLKQYELRFSELEEVIENNDSVLTSLEQSSSDCKQRYTSLLKEVSDYREASTVKDAAIKDLMVRIRSSSFAQCRVPDGISLE